jgi:hypothetical protein
LLPDHVIGSKRSIFCWPDTCMEPCHAQAVSCISGSGQEATMCVCAGLLVSARIYELPYSRSSPEDDWFAWYTYTKSHNTIAIHTVCILDMAGAHILQSSLSVDLILYCLDSILDRRPSYMPAFSSMIMDVRTPSCKRSCSACFAGKVDQKIASDNVKLHIVPSSMPLRTL